MKGFVRGFVRGIKCLLNEKKSGTGVPFFKGSTGDQAFTATEKGAHSSARSEVAGPVKHPGGWLGGFWVVCGGCLGGVWGVSRGRPKSYVFIHKINVWGVPGPSPRLDII